MNRVYIVTALAVVIVAAAVGGAYQFYFKAKFDEYREHQTQKAQLEKKLKDMAAQFEGVEPEKLVQEWTQQVNPWFNSVADDGRFFEYGVDAVPPVPEEVVSPRLYYKDEYEKMMLAIHQEAYPRIIPATNFGVPPPDAIPNNTATRQEVRQWLQKLHFGQEMIRLLLDHQAIRIDDIDVWPDVQEQNGLLTKRTIGSRFLISLEDLVNLMKFLRTAERYYTVEAIRITNPYLLTAPAPPVTVELLLTVGSFNADKLEAATASTSASSFSSASDALNRFGIRSQSTARTAGPGKFATWWRNFRKNYLPF